MPRPDQERDAQRAHGSDRPQSRLADHAQQRYDELVDKLILGSPDTLATVAAVRGGESSHRHHFGVPLGQQRLASCRFTARVQQVACTLPGRCRPARQ